MNKIIMKKKLCKTITLMEIEAPFIAKKAEPGQFIILRVDENGERIPLTIADYDREKGTIKIIYQIVGATTMHLDSLSEGDYIHDFVGPLGNKTNLDNLKKVVIVGGGVGCAIAYPIAKKLYQEKCDICSIIGFRNKGLIILENEFENVSNKLIVMTDDGSNGNKGFVTIPLEQYLEKNNNVDQIIAIGPLLMMKNVVEVGKKYNIKTIVSMNSIMIDGTGMCGGCRLTVNGKIKFACVDGPDFDGAQIDFEEVILRSKSYADFEKREKEKACNLFLKEVN